MIRRVVPLLALVFAGACCTQLPQLPQKRIAWTPLPSATSGISESTATWHDARRNRDVPVRIYAPSTPGRHPVVVFSHGIGEDRDSYAYIGNALASAGFLAVHVTHAGTDKAKLRRGWVHLFRATKDRRNWRNRPLDVSFVLDQVLRRDDADPDRVAVVGHSAGAFTAFQVAGAITPAEESFRDPRVKVVVPMSMPRIKVLTYDQVQIPVLNMTGTCDKALIFMTLPRHRRMPFDRATAPNQYLITIDGVEHESFSNKVDPHHAAIADLMVAFLRAWLIDDRTHRAWFDEPGTTTVDGDRLTVETK